MKKRGRHKEDKSEKVQHIYNWSSRWRREKNGDIQKVTAENFPRTKEAQRILRKENNTEI